MQYKERFTFESQKQKLEISSQTIRHPCLNIKSLLLFFFLHIKLFYPSLYSLRAVVLTLFNFLLWGLLIILQNRLWFTKMSVIHAVAIGIMLNNKGVDDWHRLKNVTCKQTFNVKAHSYGATVTKLFVWTLSLIGTEYILRWSCYHCHAMWTPS